MTIFLYLFSIFLGLIVGSFLNVVVLRHGTGWGLEGRSKCLSCGHKLDWFELVPVVSFLWQKGQCKHCQAKISWQYPVVEVFTALIFLLIAVVEVGQSALAIENVFSLFMVWIISSLLIIITVYDLRHKIIPDEFVFTLMLVAVASLGSLIFSDGLTEFFIRVLHGIYSGGLLFLLFWLLWFLSRGRLMGFGDAKLVFGLGLWLGLTGAAYAVALAFITGAVVGLGLIFISQSKYLAKKLPLFTLKSEVPFAPFLVLGAFISYFF